MGRSRFRVSRLRIWGSGFRVQALAFRVYGALQLKFWSWGLQEFRGLRVIKAWGLRAWGLAVRSSEVSLRLESGTVSPRWVGADPHFGLPNMGKFKKAAKATAAAAAAHCQRLRAI